jgi:TonB-linked SusC/RagA family outer membrane protein
MYRNYTTNLGMSKRHVSKIWLMIRLTTVILIAAIMQAAAATGFAQKVSLSESNATLKSVLQELKKQSGYIFLSTENQLLMANPVNIKVKNAEFSEVLERVFKDQPLTYKIKDGTIVLQEKGNSLLDNILAKINRIDVRGKVTDTTGRPIPGVTVLLKGSSKGVKTDAEGNFSIGVMSPESVLIFSSLNFKTQEVIVGEKERIDVVLKEGILDLNEVELISTGYQKINPIQSTGSISTIREKEYNSRLNTVNFLAGLQNKIPGLLINNDIVFEKNNLFQIRGISTISGGKQPLIVVDGYPTELSLEMINPNDIESVTVLKDAAAAAIYGVRSSNGVIVVERKKAKAGKVRVGLRATSSLTPKENFDKYRWDKNGSATSIDYDREVYKNSINATTWNNMNSATNGGGYGFRTSGLIMAQQAAGVITKEEADRQFSALGSYNNANDFARLFLRTAVTNTYNLDISGGNKDVLYYLSSNYIDSRATTIETGNSSFQLSGRGTFNFSDRFSLDLANNFQQGIKDAPPAPDVNSIFPYEPLEDAQGNPLPVFNGSSNANPYYNKAIMALGLLDNLYYPGVDIREITNRTKSINNRISADLNYKFSKAFNFKLGGVYEISKNDLRYLASENSSLTRQYVNRYTSSAGGVLTFNIPKGGFLKQQASSTQGYTLRGQLNFTEKIAEDHAITAIAGTELRSIVNQGNTAAYFGYNDQTLTQQAVDYRALLINNSVRGTFGPFNPRPVYADLFNQTFAENRYFSVYSNVAYTYKGKYSATGSIRIDQSNLFGTDPKYRYRPLWSAGAAWNVGQEDYIKKLGWVNFLKLRTAYGFNGNVAKNSLPQIIAVNGVNNFDAAIPILSLSSAANRGLRWEKTHNFNAGLDYNLFKNIGGSFDYYIKKSVDILANQQVDPTRGMATALINEASIKNSGFEINLNADWISGRKFNWNTGFVFSHNTSKVLDVYKNNTGGSSDFVTGTYSDYLEGYKVGAIFNYRYAGVDATGFPAVYDSAGNKKKLFTNDNKDDVEYVGSLIPSLNFGLSNRIDIAQFYVYAMVNYYGGFKARLPVPSPAAARPLEGANNYWKKAGDEADLNILPGIGSRGFDPYVLASDKYTVNGAYLTIGDVTFAYRLNTKAIKKIGMSDVEFKLQASNIYTVGFNKYDYSLATGSYAKSYLTPTYSFAVNINF